MIGRALGIGVRVAGRIAGQRLAAQPRSGASASQAPASLGRVAAGRVMQAEAAGQAAKQFATQAGRGLSRGAGGFLRPFRRVGGIVWLEVTGTFFLLFAALFALRLWQNWAGMGGAAKGFVIGAAVVFLYLGVSSFWRARRR